MRVYLLTVGLSQLCALVCGVCFCYRVSSRSHWLTALGALTDALLWTVLLWGLVLYFGAFSDTVTCSFQLLQITLVYCIISPASLAILTSAWAARLRAVKAERMEAAAAGVIASATDTETKVAVCEAAAVPG